MACVGATYELSVVITLSPTLMFPTATAKYSTNVEKRALEKKERASNFRIPHVLYVACKLLVNVMHDYFQHL